MYGFAANLIWAPQPHLQPVFAVGEPLSGSARNPPPCYFAAARHSDGSQAPRHLLLSPPLGVHSPSAILTAGGSELSVPLSQAERLDKLSLLVAAVQQGGGIKGGGPSSLVPKGPPIHHIAPAPLLTLVLWVCSTTAPVPGSLDPAPSRLSPHTGFPAAPSATSAELFSWCTVSRRILGSATSWGPFHSSHLGAHSRSAFLGAGGRERSASHDRAGGLRRFCCSSLGEQQAPPSRKVLQLRADFGRS
ncbi:hypothetical protein NDU88_005267 [Pleurodeles waltl]|uniref:Uncharacterized protein n=1 Tax=Pleurodeles waltl TaxID=8319 RepID=A0AAV7MBM2_PLEWA|nr:hypothetical protein NDU88_005267 [Pleurodeles waltl]